MPVDPVETFICAFTALRGHIHRAATWRDAAGILVEVCAQNGVDRLATAQLPPELLDALRDAAGSGKLDVLSPPYDAADLPGAIDRAGVGATGIEFAIAETATLVEVSRNDATRLVSSLPRTHVGVVSARQFVEGLFDAAPRMRQIMSAHPRECVISFLSGPSRTGDIELRLTLGVHGPENAHVLILDEKLDFGAAYG